MNLRKLFTKPEMCPTCLAEVRFESYRCPNCNEVVPAKYVKDYAKYPPVVVNAVGFQGHGKTVYFSSLFDALQRQQLNSCWPRFYYMPLNKASLKTVCEKAEELAEGKLPGGTPKVFSEPAMIQVAHIPAACVSARQRNCTLLFYDTGGESFQDPDMLDKYAPFLRRARTVMFLISTPDLERPNVSMADLLQKYMLGMVNNLKTSTKDQHLVVVYTKADEISFGKEWQDLENYLLAGSVVGMKDTKGYEKALHGISERLREFTAHRLEANMFLNIAAEHFRSVAFSMVSALGAQPVGNHLSIQTVSRRIMDPLLWMINKSL